MEPLRITLSMGDSITEDVDSLCLVNGGLIMHNSGGIKLTTFQSLTSKLRGCVDAGLRGVPHVARFLVIGRYIQGSRYSGGDPR